jgi:hypothetical protein
MNQGGGQNQVLIIRAAEKIKAVARPDGEKEDGRRNNRNIISMQGINCMQPGL